MSTVRESLERQYNAQNGKWACCGNTFVTQIWFKSDKFYAVVQFRKGFDEIRAEIVRVGYNCRWTEVSVKAEFAGPDSEDRAMDWLAEYVSRTRRQLQKSAPAFEQAHANRAEYERILKSLAG